MSPKFLVFCQQQLMLIEKVLMHYYSGSHNLIRMVWKISHKLIDLWNKIPIFEKFSVGKSFKASSLTHLTLIWNCAKFIFASKTFYKNFSDSWILVTLTIFQKVNHYFSSKCDQINFYCTKFWCFLKHLPKFVHQILKISIEYFFNLNFHGETGVYSADNAEMCLSSSRTEIVPLVMGMSQVRFLAWLCFRIVGLKTIQPLLLFLCENYGWRIILLKFSLNSVECYMVWGISISHLSSLLHAFPHYPCWLKSQHG